MVNNILNISDYYENENHKTRRAICVEAALMIVIAEAKAGTDIKQGSENTVKKYADWIQQALKYKNHDKVQLK